MLATWPELIGDEPTKTDTCDGGAPGRQPRSFPPVGSRRSRTAPPVGQAVPWRGSKTTTRVAVERRPAYASSFGSTTIQRGHSPSRSSPAAARARTRRGCSCANRTRARWARQARCPSSDPPLPVASLPCCSSSGSSSRVRNGMSGPDDCGSSPSRRPRWLPVPPGGQRTRRSRQSTCGTPRPMSLTSTSSACTPSSKLTGLRAASRNEWDSRSAPTSDLTTNLRVNRGGLAWSRSQGGHSGWDGDRPSATIGGNVARFRVRSSDLCGGRSVVRRRRGKAP
jgi:hypothetical protein